MSISKSNIPQNVPRFVSILWKMVNIPDPTVFFDPKAPDSFIISNERKFAHHILPRFCKVNKMDVFLKQLKSYGFLRCPNSVQMKFRHENFIQGQPERLVHITKVQPQDQETKKPETSHTKQPDVEVNTTTDNNPVDSKNLIKVLQEERNFRKNMQTEINELKDTVRILVNFISKNNNISLQTLFTTADDTVPNFLHNNHNQQQQQQYTSNMSGPNPSRATNQADVDNNIQMKVHRMNMKSTTNQQQQIKTNTRNETNNFGQFDNVHISEATMTPVNEFSTNMETRNAPTSDKTPQNPETTSQATIEIVPKHMCDTNDGNLNNAFSIRSFPQQTYMDRYKRSSPDFFEERPKKKRLTTMEFDSISQIDDRFSAQDEQKLQMRPVYDYECASIKEIDW